MAKKKLNNGGDRGSPASIAAPYVASPASILNKRKSTYRPSFTSLHHLDCAGFITTSTVPLVLAGILISLVVALSIIYTTDNEPKWLTQIVSQSDPPLPAYQFEINLSKDRKEPVVQLPTGAHVATEQFNKAGELNKGQNPVENEVNADTGQLTQNGETLVLHVKTTRADQQYDSSAQIETGQKEKQPGEETSLSQQADGEPNAGNVESRDVNLTISGRVLTETGQPVSGMPITASLRRSFEPTNQAAAESQRIRQAVSGAGGVYAFNELADGEYLLRTTATNYYAAAHAVARRGVNFADLVLVAQRALTIQGVVKGSGQEDVAGAQVLPLVGGIPPSTYTDAEGLFQLAVAYETNRKGFPVLFRAEGYRELRLDIREADLAESGSIELDVVLQQIYETIPVSGAVTSQWMPVASETVQLYSQSAKRTYQAITDEVGEFRFEAVEPADDYKLAVQPVGPYLDYHLPNLNVAMQEQRVEIELEPLESSASLSGRMVDVNGNPVPGVTLMARSTLTTHQALQVTGDRQGHYAIDSAPTGELVLENRSMPFYTISGVRVSAEEDDTQAEVPLVLDWGQHELRGQVVDGRNNPIPAQQIHLTWSHSNNGVRSSSSRTTAADATGQFRFTGMGPGRHTLTVNAPGFEGVRIRHEVGVQGDELLVRLEQRLTNI